MQYFILAGSFNSQNERLKSNLLSQPPHCLPRDFGGKVSDTLTKVESHPNMVGPKSLQEQLGGTDVTMWSRVDSGQQLLHLLAQD